MRYFLFLFLILSSCSSGPRPVTPGKDPCESCKMTIMDTRFAAEIVTKKNKVYKFDDLHCLVDYIKSGSIDHMIIDKVYVVNYQDKKEFIDVDHAVFLLSPGLYSPMSGNTAAFSSDEEASKVQAELSGEILVWSSLYNRIK